MNDLISESISINAATSVVWQVLTKPDLMVQWMGAPEMNLEVVTTWETDTPFLIRGFHHIAFENKGTVLCFDREQRLSYSHLSSVSRLADKPEHYTVFDFRLLSTGSQTTLELTIGNFPTEAIFKHLRFYWCTTMVMLKKFAEQVAAEYII